MQPVQEILEASVVVLGNFNPPIMSADWLLNNKLIGSEDAEDAKSKTDYVVTRQIAKVQTPSFAIQVLENQVVVATVGPVTPALPDLAVSILRLLPHTPVNALGINFTAHYKMPSAALYHKVGDTLAPKNIWSEIFPSHSVGLVDLTVTVNEGTRENPVRTQNVKRVSVQPSGRINGSGVLIKMNDHYGWGIDDKPLESAVRAAEVVTKRWEQTYTASMEIFEQLIKKATS